VGNFKDIILRRRSSELAWAGVEGPERPPEGAAPGVAMASSALARPVEVTFFSAFSFLARVENRELRRFSENQ